MISLRENHWQWMDTSSTFLPLVPLPELAVKTVWRGNVFEKQERDRLEKRKCNNTCMSLLAASVPEQHSARQAAPAADAAPSAAGAASGLLLQAEDGQPLPDAQQSDKGASAHPYMELEEAHADQACADEDEDFEAGLHQYWEIGSLPSTSTPRPAGSQEEDGAAADPVALEAFLDEGDVEQGRLALDLDMDALDAEIWQNDNVRPAPPADPHHAVDHGDEPPVRPAAARDEARAGAGAGHAEVVRNEFFLDGLGVLRYYPARGSF